MTVRIYTAGPTLQDTLAIAITDGRTYRYIFPLASWNDAEAETITADIENLDLSGAAASGTFPMMVPLSAAVGGIEVNPRAQRGVAVLDTTEPLCVELGRRGNDT